MTSSAASAARQLPLPTSDSLKKESPSPEPTEPIHDVFLAAPVSPPRSPKHSPSSGLSPPNQWNLSRTPHPTNHSVECSEFTNCAALPLSTYRRPSFDDVDNYFELSPRQPDFCAELIVATTDKLSPDSTNQALYCCQPTKLFTLSQLKMSRTPTNRNDVSQTHANQMSFDMLSEAMMLTSSPEMALHSFDDPNRFEAYPRTPQWQTSPVPYSEDFYARPQPNVNHFETVSPVASQEVVPNDLDQLDPSEFFQDYYDHDISQLDRYIHDYEEGSSSNSQHQSTLPEDMVQFAEFLPTETSSGYVFGADSSVVVEQTGRIPSATAGPYYLTTAAATTSTSSATADSSAHTTQTASTSQQRTTRTSTGRQTTSNQRYSPYAGSSGNSSDGGDEPTDYRKKRDKNNAASARSRRKRQEKMQQMKEEKVLLERKNIELRTQAETLENQVSEYKEMLRTFMCKNSGAM